MIILLIAVAGGIGALARFIIDGLLRTVLGRRFPWGTLIINTLGSFVLGLITSVALKDNVPDLQLIIGIGLCGGFTTFSTASFETVRLIQEKRYVIALAQSLGNVSFAVIAAMVGLSLA